jgi:hypothetical protein
VCELILLFSVVFHLFTSVHKRDSGRVLINKSRSVAIERFCNRDLCLSGSKLQDKQEIR